MKPQVKPLHQSAPVKTSVQRNLPVSAGSGNFGQGQFDAADFNRTYGDANIQTFALIQSLSNASALNPVEQDPYSPHSFSEAPQAPTTNFTGAVNNYAVA